MKVYIVVTGILDGERDLRVYNEEVFLRKESAQTYVEDFIKTSTKQWSRNLYEYIDRWQPLDGYYGEEFIEIDEFEVIE